MQDHAVEGSARQATDVGVPLARIALQGCGEHTGDRMAVKLLLVFEQALQYRALQCPKEEGVMLPLLKCMI